MHVNKRNNREDHFKTLLILLCVCVCVCVFLKFYCVFKAIEAKLGPILVIISFVSKKHI